jgi:hypothetical protein
MNIIKIIVITIIIIICLVCVKKKTKTKCILRCVCCKTQNDTESGKNNIGTGLFPLYNSHTYSTITGNNLHKSKVCACAWWGFIVPQQLIERCPC